VSEEVFDATSAPEFTTIHEPIRDRPDLPPRAITAAAQVLNGPKIERVKRKQTGKGLPWQTASWEFYDEIGEYSWSVELLATHVSKVRLIAARDVPGGDEPIQVGGEYELDGETHQPSQIEIDAAALVAAIAGGTAGQQQLMYRGAVQKIVAAESYVVVRPDPDGGDPRWDAYSNEEIQYSANGWKINDGTETYTLTNDDVLIRVWRPHPKKRSEPRSSSKPLLPVLAEIKGLTQSIAARIDSRLAGAGVLFIPESAALMSNQSADLEDGEDPFVAELIDSMLTPIHDRDSAAAVVPIVVRVPDESIGKVQHIRFEVTSKAEEAAQRLDAVTRMARAVDLPQEQVLGLGAMNHWGAWQADESTVKGPVATLASIDAHAYTVGYLRPALLEMGHSEEDVASLLVWYDLTDLIQRPDRSDQALQVFDRGGLSFAALLRETGFDDSDEPTEEDTCRRLLLQMVEADPTNAAKWLEALGPCAGLTLPPLTDIFGDGSVMVPQQPGQPGVPAIEPTGQQGPPNTDQQQLTASVVVAEGACPDPVDCLYGTCELAVLRALELAGKRMRGSSPRNVRSGLLTVPAHELHCNGVVASASTHTTDSLMEGAWSPLAITLPHREALVADLDQYVRLLIETRQPHDPEWLRPIVAKHAA
jgi:hypothetical protein